MLPPACVPPPAQMPPTAQHEPAWLCRSQFCKQQLRVAPSCAAAADGSLSFARYAGALCFTLYSATEHRSSATKT